MMHGHLPITDFHQHLTYKKSELMNARSFLDCFIFYSIWGQLAGWCISQSSGQETETTQDILIRNEYREFILKKLFEAFEILLASMCHQFGSIKFNIFFWQVLMFLMSTCTWLSWQDSDITYPVPPCGPEPGDKYQQGPIEPHQLSTSDQVNLGEVLLEFWASLL